MFRKVTPALIVTGINYILGNNTPLLKGADRVDDARHVPMQEAIHQENDLLKNYLDKGRNKSIFDSQRIPNITYEFSM